VNIKVEELKIRAAAVMAGLDGMKALNTYREGVGHGIAYDDAPFLEAAKELRLIADAIAAEAEKDERP
jgi:hypothetical protein